MNLTIGDNIKRLRRAKNVTQETLAEQLNISCPAISKWERNDTYPDITMILPLAGYFGVSTDELLGFDVAKNEERIQQLLKEKEALLMAGKWKESVQLIQEAHKEFPNDFRITYDYMYLIIGGNADNPKDVLLAHADELTTLCEQILDECTVDFIRNGSIDILAKVSKAQGNVDKALELLEQFPDWQGNIKGQKSEQLFDKDTDEWWYWIQRNFFDLSYFAINKLEKIIWFSDKSFDEKADSTLRMIEYTLKVCEDASYEPGYMIVMGAYGLMAYKYNLKGDYTKASEYYDLCMMYAKKYDDFVVSDRQIPHTTSKLKYDMAAHMSLGKSNQVKRMIVWFDEAPILEELRKTKNFQKVLNKYRPYAKDLEK